MVSAGEDTLGPGSTVLSIGFGQTTDSGSDANTLRYSISKTITLSDTRYLLYPNAGGGLCYGDSGGGTLATIGGVEKLIGINKGLSDATCSIGNSYIERASHDLAWIEAQLALPPPPVSCGLCMRNVSSGEGTCMAADSACGWNADCSNFRACFEKCSDDACRIACESKYPVGVGPYYALARCQCDGCSATCAATPRCTLLPKSKCGYPFEPTTCSSCLEARCCTQIGACADDGQCHDCLAEDDAPHACASNALRSALRTCADAQCAVQCAPPDSGAADADAVPESGVDTQVDAPSGPTTNDATDDGPFEGSCMWGSSPRNGSAWLSCITVLAIVGSFAQRRRGQLRQRFTTPFQRERQDRMMTMSRRSSRRLAVLFGLGFGILVSGNGGCKKKDGAAPAEAEYGGGGAECNPAPMSSYCDYNTVSCSPYFACNMAMHTCATSCYNTGDCVAGYVCANARCVMPGTCGGCNLDSQCGDYKCNNLSGTCQTSCGTDYDCSYGKTCAGGKCVQAGAPGSGTCGYDSDCGAAKCDTFSHQCKSGCYNDYDCAVGAHCKAGACGW
jgi:hypothetical protein